MPLGIKRVRKPQIQKGEMSTKKAARRLIEFEKNLMSDESSIDNSKCKNNSNVDMDTADSESNTVLITKPNLHNAEVNTMFSKKRKKSIVDKSGDTLEPTKKKKKKKLNTKTCNTDETVELKDAHDTDITYNNLKCMKAKKAHFSNVQLSETVQYTSPLSILKKEDHPKKTDKFAKNTLSKNNVSQNTILNDTVITSLKKVTSF